MLDLDDLCASACARLKHSVGTSAGMHKRQLRLKAEAMRKDLQRIELRLPTSYWRFTGDVVDIEFVGANGKYLRSVSGAVNLAAGEI